MSVWLQLVWVTASSVIDSNGVARSLLLRDVLHVPEAGKNLISVSELSKSGYQCVLPSKSPVFPPGLYSGKKSSDGSLQHLPFDSVGSLFYLRTLCDLELPVCHGSMNT